MGPLPMLSFVHQALAVLENRLQKPDSQTKMKQDYKQQQALACSLGGYSHREHCRSPYDKMNITRQSQNKTTSNCKRLLAASGATPIRSTAVPLMMKVVQAAINLPAQRYDRKNDPCPQLQDQADPSKEDQTQQAWHQKQQHLRLGRGSIRNHTCTRDSRSRRRTGLTNSSRRALRMLGNCSRVSRPQVDSSSTSGRSGRSSRSAARQTLSDSRTKENRTGKI